MDSAALDGARLKEDRLADWLRQQGSVLVGYSGGVDSTYLAVLAREVLGRERLIAVLGQSPSVPNDQGLNALEIANACDIDLRIVATGEVEDTRYAANPVNRCYFCKTVLWDVLCPMASALGMATVVDGTNADDLTGHRPGARAAHEHDVQSPLALVGLTKGEIRLLSQTRGLATWSQPSAPCLASRIPYGTPVTVDRLSQVDRAEQALRALGITGDLRVRHHDDLARIELEGTLIDHWLEPRNSRLLVDAVRAAGFRRVALDLRGFRSGSLNVLEGVVAA
jgi:uncharacterized protein